MFLNALALAWTGLIKHSRVHLKFVQLLPDEFSHQIELILCDMSFCCHRLENVFFLLRFSLESNSISW